MKKKVLSLAIAAVMAPGFAAAAEVSGFADFIYTITDDANKPTPPAKHPTEGKISAAGEVDFSASPADGVTARIDADLVLDALSTTDSGSIEQAFFAWGVTKGITIIGGVINDPIGYEAEDAPDMDFTTHGAVYTTLDSQTALPGDNIVGFAIAGAVGPATVTFALMNDVAQTNEENSVALVVNYSPVKGLDLELGMVTQADNMYTGTTIKADGSANALSAGNVADFNVVYTGIQNLTVGLDYLAGSEVVDSAYDLWAGYKFGNGFGAKVRVSDISYNASEVANIVTNVGAGPATAALSAANLAGADQDSTTIYLTYQIASNLSAALEFRTDGFSTPGAADRDTAQLKLIATF